MVFFLKGHSTNFGGLNTPSPLVAAAPEYRLGMVSQVISNVGIKCAT